jgi:hypothetical protein
MNYFFYGTYLDFGEGMISLKNGSFDALYVYDYSHDRLKIFKQDGDVWSQHERRMLSYTNLVSKHKVPIIDSMMKNTLYQYFGL